MKLPDENFDCAIEGLPVQVGGTVRGFEGSFFSGIQQRMRMNSLHQLQNQNRT